METYILDSNITLGRLQERIKTLPVSHLSPKFAVTIESSKKVRSRRANSYYWVCMTFIANQKPMGLVYLPEVWHYYFGGLYLEKQEIVNPMTGDISYFPVSTTKLSTKKFNKYIEDIGQHLLHEWGILLPEPYME